MKKTATTCPLYGKPECDVLNMQSCKDCPMRDQEVRENMQSDVRLFTSLLPEEGIAPLFESPDCQLCRGEDKNPRDGYGILDLGHREPKRTVRSGFLRLKKKDPVGFIAPLQFAICKKCRQRLLLLEYLPLLAPVLLTVLAIVLVANEAILEKMKDVSVFLPLITVIAAILIGYGIGQVLSAAAAKAYARSMYVDPMEHPAVKTMQDKGWFLLIAQKRPRLVFTRKAIAQGMGSAPSAAHRALCEELASEAAEQAAADAEPAEKRD